MIRLIRVLVFNRRKFTVYMRSGNVLRFTARRETYSYTKPGATDKGWQYDFAAMKPYYNIDWSQVEAVAVE